MHTLCGNRLLNIRFDWSTEKNQRPVEQRGISFESVVSAVEQGGLVDVLVHPNQERYPGQILYLVEADEYLHRVLFITETDGTRILKTIAPNRKEQRTRRRRPRP